MTTFTCVSPYLFAAGVCNMCGRIPSHLLFGVERREDDAPTPASVAAHQDPHERGPPVHRDGVRTPLRLGPEQQLWPASPRLQGEHRVPPGRHDRRSGVHRQAGPPERRPCRPMRPPPPGGDQCREGLCFQHFHAGKVLILCSSIF